jgi:D-galactarolactone cycloisomerase
MKITQITTHHLSHTLEKQFESASMRFTSREHLLLEIQCDNGLIGWGECLGNRIVNDAFIKAMTPLLIGKHALDIEPIWLMLYNTFRDQGQRGATINAISGIDIALWDLAGKFYQCPTYQLMGGAFRTRIPAYATGGFRMIGEDRIESLVKEVSDYKEQGFEAVKIKIGFGVDLDVESIKAVRQCLGNNVELMIDANHGYDHIDAARVANQVANCNILWFEEPVVPEALSSYNKLRATQPIPLAGGETWHSRWGINEALKQNTVDILQPDVCGVGGLSEAKKILTLCDIYGVRCVPHVWGTSIALAASLHFHAIIPPSPPSPGSTSPRFEFDQTHNPFRSSIVTAPFELDNGHLNVPNGHGLGIEIIREELTKYAPQH